MLHMIFQRNGLTPDKVMVLPSGVRAFLFASLLVQLEDEKEAREQRNVRR